MTINWTADEKHFEYKEDHEGELPFGTDIIISSHATCDLQNIVVWCHYRYSGGACISAELVGYVDGVKVYCKLMKKRRYCHPHSYKLTIAKERIEDYLAKKASV